MNQKGQRASYATRQKKELEQYLETIPGVHITAAQVRDYFRSQGRDIGTATIYRQLEKMVDDGIVNKYFIDSTSSACFAYAGHNGHISDNVCFHCKCEKCGRLIHMHCDELETIQKHLMESHHFAMNPLKTVFYGICEECQSASGTAGDKA